MWSRNLLGILMGGLLASGAAATEIKITTTQDSLVTPSRRAQCSLQEAIQAADSNTALQGCVAGSTTGTDLLSLRNGTYALSQALVLTSPTRLRGTNRQRTIVTARNQDRIVTTQLDPGEQVRLHHLTLTQGTRGPGFPGGCIWHTQGHLILDHVTVEHCQGSNGGAIYNGFNATMEIVDSTIRLSTASKRGGGIFNNGTLTIRRSVIEQNSAGDGGGGIAHGHGTLLLEDVQILRNQTASDDPTRMAEHPLDGGGGGGLMNLGTLTAQRTIMRENQAPFGGGLWTWSTPVGSTITLHGTLIDGNTAQRGGGGVWAREKPLAVLALSRLCDNTVLDHWITHTAGPSDIEYTLDALPQIEAGSEACVLLEGPGQ